MMDRTPNRGYPYPECDPPLTKDASDVAQLRDLAQAVADDVQAIIDRSDDILIRPDGARMTASGSTTEAQTFPVFTVSTFDTTGGGMTVGTGGVMRLVETGWYMAGTMVQLTSTTFQGLRLRFLVNGIAATSWSPPGDIIATNQQIAQHSAWIVCQNPNDELSIQVRSGALTPTFTYSAALWAQQMAQV